ncbi:MAG: sigma-70 family RNA polymerase sigma factor [Clostridia bacterium]|nr:sigma-70 family RNA polymerase sigma factor [Clostridia bacterium]
MLVDKYGNMILRLSYTYLKSIADAEDAVQDVFLKIVEKMPNFNDETHEKLWIVRTTINICKNKLKLFWNKNVYSIDNVKEIASFDKYNEDSEVLKAVMALPEKYRTVIYLYYYEEYSTPEIAKLINKNESTVRSLLHRAREKLKSSLKEAYDFE